MAALPSFHAHGDTQNAPRKAEKMQLSFTFAAIEMADVSARKRASDAWLAVERRNNNPVNRNISTALATDAISLGRVRDTGKDDHDHCQNSQPSRYHANLLHRSISYSNDLVGQFAEERRESPDTVFRNSG